MSSIIPNRTLLTGNIQALRPHAGRENFCILEIQPASITDVSSFPNLLNTRHHGILEIEINRDVQQQHHLETGMVISCQVRKAPGSLFIIPDSIQVLPATDKR